MRSRVLAPLVVSAVVFLAGCGSDAGDDGSSAQDGIERDDAMGSDDAMSGDDAMGDDAMSGDDAMGNDAMGGDGMGGDDAMGGDDGMGSDDGMGALGGSARTTLLAESTVERLADEPLAWSAFAVTDVEHEHAASFVHALEATTLTISGDEQELEEGSALFVPGETPHRHGPGSAWDVLLAAPDVAAPAGVMDGAVFRSDPLEGLPSGEAELRALLVELPPDTETSVHTHPGPEYIYATRGPFIYENGIIGEADTSEGDDHTLPAGVAVQKRNPSGGDEAAFLSWFVVDPDQPFAPPASFDE